MKKIVFLAWLIVLLPPMVVAQDKVEAPVWEKGSVHDFRNHQS
jgi:hypothetical protein